MVSDSGGFDDKSFNETSYNGLTKAVTDLGIQEKHVQSVTADDYAKNVQAMVSANCNIIIGVGYNLQDAITQSAQANPNIKYALVDSGPTTPLPNAKGLVFNTNEAAFLGGYLAASLSQTGTVGTYGGQQIPSVTIYMDGFWDGVQYYNQQKGTDVKVLGWDETTQQGQFVQSTSPFSDVTAGKTTADAQIGQGADVIFPVAGNAGTGALQSAQASNGKVSAIWVDTDGCESASQYCSVMPTSVYKGMDVAVEQVIKDTLNGQFTSANYIGDLANQGVGISPFHDWASKIPQATQDELTQIEQGLIAGTIKADSPSTNS
jgi:basic membrane protein A